MKKTSKKSELVVAGLLEYLSETKQASLLPEVSHAISRLFQEGKEAKEIVVTSVIDLTPRQKENFRSILFKLLSVDLPIVSKIDQKLLGGFTVTAGDWFLDTSISRELKTIKDTLLT